MSERELLEAAAKAAGMTWLVWTPGASPLVPYEHRAQADNGHWNPLAYDGDALRLAVKLNLTCRFYFGNTCAQATVPGNPSAYVDVQNTADPMAGARRAIVRAAAEIGRAEDGRNKND